MHFSNIILNNYNIFNVIDQNKQVINLIILIIIDFKLNRNLIATNFLDLYIYIIIDSDYSYYSFINHLIFIIYKNTYSRFIKSIKKNQV